ncbi:MAG: DUF1206 domain-containing protein [Candidatus Dormibacteraeota bacterium]|nr:DUF1206 domain-containing protein [Candidatus Dormibacteraeota bacterium]
MTKVKNDAQNAAQRTMDNPWVERLIRVGYVMRGVLYAVVGILAVQVAIGAGGATTDKNGAIATIGGEPFGKFLLVLVAVGLAAYSVWGFMRALFDPLHRGTDPKGLAVRAGYAVSGLAYASLFVLTAHFLSGQGGGQGGSGSQELTAGLLHQPFGPWLVGLMGLIGMAGGLGQMWQAFTTDFKKDWKLGEMSAQTQQAAIAIGRFGLAARGVIFLMLGFFVLQAGLHVDPKQAKGMDAALLTLAHQPFGPILLGVVALGLVSFGLYSMLCGRFIRLG